MNGTALRRPLCRRRDEMLTQELNRFMEAHTAKPCNGIIYEATRNLDFAWDGKLISECLSARKIKKKILARNFILRVNAIGVNLSRSASSDEQEKVENRSVSVVSMSFNALMSRPWLRFLAPIKANVLRIATESNVERNETIVAKVALIKTPPMPSELRNLSTTTMAAQG